MEEQIKILEQVDQIVKVMKEDSCYQDLLLIQEEMKENETLLKKIDLVKELQKKWVKNTTQKKEIEQELIQAKEDLESIPLYRSYLEKIEEVNQMVEKVENLINSYLEKIK